MAKRAKQEIIDAVKAVIGDRTDDQVISLLEDIADSYPDDSVDWQKKLDDLDKEWRGRYMERFNAPINAEGSASNGEDNKDTVDQGDNEDVVEDTEDTEDLIDDLFETDDGEGDD